MFRMFESFVYILNLENKLQIYIGRDVSRPYETLYFVGMEYIPSVASKKHFPIFPEAYYLYI